MRNKILGTIGIGVAAIAVMGALLYFAGIVPLSDSGASSRRGVSRAAESMSVSEPGLGSDADAALAVTANTAASTDAEAHPTMTQTGAPDGEGESKAENEATSDDEATPVAEPEPTAIAVASLTLSHSTMDILVHSAFDISCVVSPEDATERTLTWSSSDPAVVARLSDGRWLAMGAGSAEIVASATNGLRAVCTVTVVVPVEAIALDHQAATINRRDSLALTPTLYPADATDRRVVYTSTDASVASVSDDGVISAKGAGTVEILCTSSNGISASCLVTVVVPVERVLIEINRTRFKIGETASFRAVVLPDDATDKSLAISLSGDSATLIGEDAVSCLHSGSASIIAEAANGVRGERAIRIIDLDEYAAEVLRLTNAERSSHGLSALSSTSALSGAAFTRARELVRHYSHNRPDGRDCWSAFDEHGVHYGRAAENIAMGYDSPASVVAGWMDSPGHRANILDSRLGHMGVGVEMDTSGKLYWTQDFTN